MKTETLSATNDLRFNTTKKVGKTFIKVAIRLNDECKNGHQDFAITGNIYERLSQGERFDSIDGKIIDGVKYNFSSGGCCHEEILKHFPEFDIFVNLHLCDFEGVPMYAVENGFYHLKNGFNRTKVEYSNFKDEFCKYYRIDSIQFDALSQSRNQLQYALNLENLGILMQWKDEANKAIELLENLTGKKFLVDSKKSQYHAPTEEQIKDEKEKELNGYYTAKAELARAKEKQTKLLSKLQAERDKDILKATTEFEVKKEVLLIGGEVALNNCIFYNHSNTVAFNWKGYDQISNELINTIIEKAKFPDGVKIENKSN